MIRGTYTSESGLVAAQARMDMLSNNIANASTTGFKEILATQTDVGTTVGLIFGDGTSWNGLGPMSYGTMATGVTVNHLQGPLLTTGIPSDLGITGDGLFAVGTPTGVAYTRAGDFVIDAAGTLTTQAGQPVLDTTGRPVAVPAGGTGFAVAPDGTVAGSGQRIALVSFPTTGVTRLGENLYSIAGPVAPVAAGAGTMVQGALEGSNVNMANSMTELIAVQRTFQLSARSLTLQDGTLEEANSVGKLK
jgi:flagellar basal-body rod protein FlgG